MKEQLKYYEDTTEKRTITKEDIEFLQTLQKELNTQDTLGQADPRYWVIRDTDKILVGVGDGNEDVLLDEDRNPVTWDELPEFLKDIVKDIYGDTAEVLNEGNFLSPCIRIVTTDWDKNEVTEETFYNINDVADWLKEYGYNVSAAGLLYYSKSCDDTMFLTRKAALEHLKSNDYHYSEAAHTYAMTAWRNPEMDRLIEILHKVAWEKIKTE